MKQDRPSLTALLVAFARAIASHERELVQACDDPFAEQLLPSPLANLLRQASGSPASATLLYGLRASLLGLGEHMALRTRLIDDAVNDAVSQGAQSLVILGAGLDSRAHRLASLSGCEVFEVDFPSTQRFKRARARALPLRARALHYVPCDFEQSQLDDALRRSGFDAQAPSVWVWEGVTMYLTPAMVASSLKAIAHLSAERSRLIATYLVPFPQKRQALATLGLSVLGALSEPIRGMFTSEVMAALLRQHGFAPLSDFSPRASASHFGIRYPRLALGAPGERVVVAEKCAPSEQRALD